MTGTCPGTPPRARSYVVSGARGAGLHCPPSEEEDVDNSGDDIVMVVVVMEP